MMSFSRTLLCSALLAGIGCGSARAGYVVFGNLNNSNGSFLGAASSTKGLGPLAQSFTGGFGTITDVTLGLFNGSADGHSVIITLNADSGNTPGSIIYNFGVVADSAIGVAFDSTIAFHNLNIVMAAGSKYWIEVADSDSSATTSSRKTSVRWSTAQNMGGTGITGQSIFSGGSTSSNETNVPLIMEVAAPEPATLAVLGIGIAGLGWARSRRKRAVSSS